MSQTNKNTSSIDTLSKIWASLLIFGFLFAIVQYASGSADVFANILKGLFDYAKLGFEIALGLTGVMALWLGIMKIGERAGVIQMLTYALSPLFKCLFPSVPANHPALSAITMNMAANILGLDNAATPMGLKAMKELQSLNASSSIASNEQILFLVINTSSVTLFPVSIFAYRLQYGAANPTDVFIPIILATVFSTLVGLLSVAWIQKIKLWNKTILSYFAAFFALIALIVWYFSGLKADKLQTQSSLISSVLILAIITSFVIMGWYKKINLYETFIEGGKEGFSVALSIIPHLVGILVAISVFRNSGALDYILQGFRWLLSLLQMDTQFVEALPTALMKPLSGSGARGMMLDAMKANGVDSFVGRLASTIQGSTETTFYVLAVYFGSVGITKTRHALKCGLLADLAGAIAAIVVCYLFFT